MINEWETKITKNHSFLFALVFANKLLTICNFI